MPLLERKEKVKSLANRSFLRHHPHKRKQTMIKRSRFACVCVVLLSCGVVVFVAGDISPFSQKKFAPSSLAFSPPAGRIGKEANDASPPPSPWPPPWPPRAPPDERKFVEEQKESEKRTTGVGGNSGAGTLWMFCMSFTMVFVIILSVWLKLREFTLSPEMQYRASARRPIILRKNHAPLERVD